MKVLLFFAALMATVLAETAKSSLEIPTGTYYSDPVFQSRIVNGQEAQPGQFPYQVFLIGYRDNMRTISILQCGGAIIHSNWVITAAHCLFEGTTKLGSFSLEAGSIYSGSGTAGQWQKRTVLGTNTHPHPAFDRSTLANDVGLLNIQIGFYLDDGPYVKAVPLPWATGDMESNVGEKLTVSGYGRTVTGGPTSTRLLWTNLEAISHASCQAYYADVVPSTCFCAQNKTSPYSSTCQGDSGGPITMMINNIPTLVGIVSFGGSTCLTIPQGFTKLTYYLSWITLQQQS